MPPISVAASVRMPPCGIASTALKTRLTNTSRNSDSSPMMSAPQNAGQRVVEVVRHARRQFAQRRHLFNLRKLLANALLLSNIVIQFRDVAFDFLRMGCYFFRFSGRSHRLYVSQVGAIGEIDNGNDRCSRDEGVEPGEVCNLGYDYRRRCSGDKCNGRPEIILVPDMPDGLIHL